MARRLLLIFLLGSSAHAHMCDGVTTSGYYATDFGGNPVGGLKSNLIYSGFLDLGIAFDLEKIAHLPGMALTVSQYLASGQDLSNDVGNFYTVQQVFTEGNYFFGILKLSLDLFQKRVIFEVGRLLAGDLFAQNELWQYYVTGAVNINPESMEENIFFPVYNIAAWAVRAIFEPNSHWQFLAGLYNADPNVENPNSHGLYFRLSMDKGYLALGQINYRHHYDRKSDGLPGQINFGGYYESSTFDEVANPMRSRRGNYGLYVIFDQMLFREEWLEFDGPSHLGAGAPYAEKAKKNFHQRLVVPKDRPQGLTAWALAYVAPQEKINIQSYELAGGLLYQGLFCGRKRDVTAFCIVRGKFSNTLQDQEAETILELNHRFQLTSHSYITPDLQYIIKPDGRTDIPNGLVFAIEASFNF